MGSPFPCLWPRGLLSLPPVPLAGGCGHVLPWEKDATGDRKGLTATAKGSEEMVLGGASLPLPPARGPARCLPGEAGESRVGPRGAEAVQAQPPRPPLQPAVPLTESRDSHNYWDYKERVIDLQPALCDQRPGGPPTPSPPLLL